MRPSVPIRSREAVVLPLCNAPPQWGILDESGIRKAALAVKEARPSGFRAFFARLDPEWESMPAALLCTDEEAG